MTGYSEPGTACIKAVNAVIRQNKLVDANHAVLAESPDHHLIPQGE